MNNTDYKTLVEVFSHSFDEVVNSKNLVDLKENYIKMEINRENVFEWVLTKIEDDAQKSEYLTEFANTENSIWSGRYIPEFDESFSFEDIDTLFEEYGSYFQRYGCLNSDQIISWDKENVLFDDEFGNVDIIKRPDTILNMQ